MVKRVVIAGVVLIIAGLAAMLILRNILVERAVEVGGEYALGVPTDLGSARVNLDGARLELHDLQIDNPEGFTGERFMAMRHAVMDVDAGLLSTDLVAIDSFVIEGVELHLEQIDNQGNFRTILDHVNGLTNEPSETSTSRFKFGLIAIRDIDVSGSLSLLGQPAAEKSYKLEQITLRDVGGENGATVSEVTGIVVRTLLTKALAAGKGMLPGGFGEKLSDVTDEAKRKAQESATQEVESAVKSLLGGGK